MDRDRALELLASTSAHERLLSARYLRNAARPEDKPRLARALREETVSWVRRALQSAVERLDDVSARHLSNVPASSAPPADAVVRQVHARATEEVTATILHEFQPILGLLKTAARAEIVNFETSQTSTQLSRIDTLISGIETLKRAATTPRLRELDFAELVRACAAEEAGDDANILSLRGPSPMLIHFDSGLLKLAIVNGLRNAMDAVLLLKNRLEDGDIVITWGFTDIDAWLAILDRGPGLATGAAEAFRIGTTTKVNHSGLGLAIAKQAMESMEGTIGLTPVEPMGARFEIRWYR